MQRIVLLSVLLVYNALQAESYSSGAPTKVCTSMVPGHGSEQSGANPYSITLSSNKYTAGGSITATINGGSFQGMLMQVRGKGSTTKYGQFTAYATNTRLLDCTSASDSVTHSNMNSKSAAEFTWKAPSSDVGELEFVATVNQNKNTWWLNTKSASLTYDSGAAAATTTASSSTMTTQSSDASTQTSESAGSEGSTKSGMTSSTTTKRILTPNKKPSSGVSLWKPCQHVFWLSLGVCLYLKNFLQ